MHGTQKIVYPSIPSQEVPGSTCLAWFAIALDATAIKSTECKRSQAISQFDGQRVHVDAIRKMLIENHNSVMQKDVLRNKLPLNLFGWWNDRNTQRRRVTHVRPSKFGALQCSICIVSLFSTNYYLRYWIWPCQKWQTFWKVSFDKRAVCFVCATFVVVVVSLGCMSHELMTAAWSR